MTHLRRWLLAGILAAHFFLGAAYSVIVPIWEGYDETGHFPYLRYVATRWSLPPAGGQLTEWLDQAHQPPLYYMLGALATFWIDTGDDLQPKINLHAWDGTGRSGYNIALHTEDEAFPYQGSVLAFHVARLVSVLLSTIAIGVTYLLAKEVFAEREELVLGATALAAFSPTFLFVGSIVNNDVLVALMAAAALLLILRTAKQQDPSTLQLGVLGSVLGLALLSKNSALALLPMLAIGFAVPILSGRWTWVRGAVRGGVALAVATVVSGWWYARNLILYGTPIPDRAPENPITTTVAPFFTSAPEAVTLEWVSTLVGNTFQSFWGYFGWGNVNITDQAVFLVLGLFTLAGLAGGFLLFRAPALGREAKSALGFLAASVPVFLVLPLYRAVFFRDPFLVPGRYLLPAMPAISTLLVGGAVWLAPARVAARLVAALTASLFVLAVIVPARYIVPRYAPPPRFAEGEIQIPNPVRLRYGDRLELLGYELLDREVLPGDELDVRLYWRPLRPMFEDYTVGIHILGRDLRDWGQVNTHPGPGTYPTSRWRLGEVILDTYRVPLSSAAEVPALGRLSVGVQLYPEGGDLAVYDGSGNEVTPIFALFKLASPSPPQFSIDHPTEYSLGTSLQLAGYDLDGTSLTAGETLRVVLYWAVRSAVDEDYIVFVHLLDPSGALAAQHDAPPQGGEYPTSIWSVGELVQDERLLPIPSDLAPGTYSVAVGMYPLETLERLPAYDADGDRLPHDEIVLFPVTLDGSSS